MFDVPRSELKRVIEQFCRRATVAKVATLDGDSFKTDQRLEVSPENQARILNAKSLSVVSGVFKSAAVIDLWIWPHENSQTFEAEFVFFGDCLFGEKDTDEQHRSNFGVVYSLAEMVRQNHPACDCAASESEVEDPRDERERDRSVFW